MRKMLKFCTGKVVILLDSSHNNPVIAKRIVRRFSYRFPLYDKDGNVITEEQAARKKDKKSSKDAQK